MNDILVARLTDILVQASLGLIWQRYVPVEQSGTSNRIPDFPASARTWQEYQQEGRHCKPVSQIQSAQSLERGGKRRRAIEDVQSQLACLDNTDFDIGIL